MSLYWCNTCKIPIYKDKCPVCSQKADYLAQDVRPVFPEEVLLLEVLLHKRGELRGKAIWNAKGNRYLVDGKEMEFSLQHVLAEANIEQVRNLLEEEKRQSLDLLYEDFKNSIDLFVRANVEHFRELEYNSLEFIKKITNKYSERIPVVSFSGGKDSTVVSSLVRRAFGMPVVLHVFGDTTLEVPTTYEYVKRFRKINRRIPFFVPKSNHNFLHLCDQIGPPSRVMRWCCTVFKTGPIGDVIDRFAENKKILTFYGVRRSESTRRSKYEEVMDSPKIAKQIVASPIIDWMDIDIWLYLFTLGEDFNDAYRAGFSRVGCWCCPSNSDWSFLLAQILIPKEAEAWRNFLVSFAKRIGKPDPEEYIDSGNWKARQGGNGLEADYSIVKFEPCATEELARNYQLTRPISEEFYEYFKPFGVISYPTNQKLFGEVTILDRRNQQPLFTLLGNVGQTHLKVRAYQNEYFRLLITRVECQLKKYQACFGCGGCPAICPQKAINLIGSEYHIDEERCVGCLKCIAHYDQGCLAAKVTKTRRTPA